MSSDAAPSPVAVLDAFGLGGSQLLRLTGGQGRTWRVGDVVLKPVEDTVEHDWVCSVFAGWDHHDSVRVPEPLATSEGAWSYDGWGAHRYVAGHSASMRSDFSAIRAASDAFHAAVGDVACPAFIAQRQDRWSHADRVAWDGAEPRGEAPTLKQIDRLRAVFGDVSAAPQVIHGDIGGNVLVEPGRVAAVIDWPPYHRPPGLALAVAVVDAICWEAVPLSFVDSWADVPQWEQLLARALVFRLATEGVEAASRPDVDHAVIGEPLVALLVRRLS